MVTGVDSLDSSDSSDWLLGMILGVDNCEMSPGDERRAFFRGVSRLAYRVSVSTDR